MIVNDLELDRFIYTDFLVQPATSFRWNFKSLKSQFVECQLNAVEIARGITKVASYRVWAEWIRGNWNSCCWRVRRWGRSGWTTTKLCLHRDENCEPAGLAEPSTPPIWPGWGWNRRPCPPSPAARSTSHCRTSPKQRPIQRKCSISTWRNTIPAERI